MVHFQDLIAEKEGERERASNNSICNTKVQVSITVVQYGSTSSSSNANAFNITTYSYTTSSPLLLLRPIGLLPNVHKICNSLILLGNCHCHSCSSMCVLLESDMKKIVPTTYLCQKYQMNVNFRHFIAIQKQ